MTDARELYQQLMLEHARAPRNEGELADATHRRRGANPLCGDRVDVDVRVDDGRVAAIRFRARGCAIAKASASIMTELVAGMTVEEVRALAARLEALLAKDNVETDAALEPLLGVRRFRGRAQCATLAFVTLRSALDGGTG